jgi:hypothetical protein
LKLIMMRGTSSSLWSGKPIEPDITVGTSYR